LSGKHFPYSQWIIGGLGVLIAVIEGLQQLYQYQANWINYRSTCESLKQKIFISRQGRTLRSGQGSTRTPRGKN
jgi:hypothetical protein